MMSFNSMMNWHGQMLGRYRMLQLLGRGSTAEVWLAEDTQLRRQVAVKSLSVVTRGDQRYLQDFKREARAATELHHPNILPVHDFGQQQIGPDEVITYVVMPLITGGSLRERIRQANGPLPSGQALHYLRQAAAAIDYAHSRNVLHLDIKPANMLLQQDQLLLADFGLARLLPTVTQGRTYTGVGTPEYMAPEQAQGQPTPASDLYSLAMSAYQLFTGRLPFTSNPDDPPYIVLMKQIQEAPIAPRQFNPALPPAVEQAILQGLAKNPQARPPTCAALVEAIAGGWQANAVSDLVGTPDASPAQMSADPEATVLAPWSRRRLQEQKPPVQKVWLESLSAMPAPEIAQGPVPMPASPSRPAVPPPIPMVPPSTPAAQMPPVTPQPLSAPTMPAPSPMMADMQPPAASLYATTPDAPTAVSANAPTCVSGNVPIPYPPQTAGQTQTQVAPAQPGSEKKPVFGRRAFLVGGAATLVAAAGGTSLYLIFRSCTGTRKPTTNTPRPAPGPHKLIAGVPLLSLTGHTKTVNVVAWDPTGRYLASASEDTRVMLWDIGSYLKQNSHGLQVISTPQHAWNISNPAKIDEFDLNANALCWSPDGRYLTVTTNTDSIFLIDAFNTKITLPSQTYKDQHENDFNTPSYQTVSWSPAIRNMFVVSRFLSGATQLEADIWQVGEITTPVRRLLYADATTAGANGASLDIASWAPDGSLIAGYTDYGKVILWDAVSGTVRQTINLPDRPSAAASIVPSPCQQWSPTDPHLLAMSNLDIAMIWDVQNNKALLSLELDEPVLKQSHITPYVWGLSWAPNGKYMTMCYPRDPRIYIWDVQLTGASAAQGNTRKEIIAFPDTHHPVHTAAVLDVAWSPDGRYIASASGDQTIVVWKVDGA